MKIIKRALTFEDVLLVPQYSDILPKQVDIRSKFSKNIELNIPVVSAAMDTVTEHRTAIMMARLGGIGVIHKNMDLESQLKEVKKVKKSESGVIMDPISITADASIKDALELMSDYRISGVPVIDENSVLIDNYLFDNDIDDYDINGTHPIIDSGETDSNDCNIKFE